MKLRITPIAICLLLGLAGCAPFAKATATPGPTATAALVAADTEVVEATPTGTPVPTDTPAPTVEVVVTVYPEDVSPSAEIVTPTPWPTLTFTDLAANYAIDYPADWFVWQSEPGMVASITSFDMSGSQAQGGVPPDQAKIDIVPNPSGRPETLDAMAERARTELQVSEEYVVELAGGIPAVVMRGSGNISGDTALLLAVIQGESILIQGYGDISRFNAIASTLRAIEGSALPPTPVVEAPECARTAPFAEGCLGVERPADLPEGVEITGILPETGVGAVAFSPDGNYLAYAISVAAPSSQGIIVRSLPDFAITASWSVPGVDTLFWTPDGAAVLFTFDRGDYSTGIGLARIGEEQWRDLLPAGQMTVSDAKSFEGWVDRGGETPPLLAFSVGCGTGCRSLYSLDIGSGALAPLVGVPDQEGGYTQVFGTTYEFSPGIAGEVDGGGGETPLSAGGETPPLLAVTNWGSGLPQASVLPWPGPGEPISLGAEVGTNYTDALDWGGSELAFLAYPAGDPSTWEAQPQLTLYVWDSETGTSLSVAEGAMNAAFSPQADLLAVLFAGEPRQSPDGLVRAEPAEPFPNPYVGLVSWPEGTLLASHKLSEQDIVGVFAMGTLPAPVWSPYGQAVLLRPQDDALALMRRDGTFQPVLSADEEGTVPASWGQGYLAFVEDQQVWVVRAP